MPEINVIDRVKETINNLGDEPAYLAEAGITLEEITPPEPEIDAELDDLLDADVGEDTNLEERITEDIVEDDLFNDFDSEPSTDMSDSLDLPEGQLEINPEELEEIGSDSFEEEGLEDIEDLGSLDDLEDLDDAPLEGALEEVEDSIDINDMEPTPPLSEDGLTDFGEDLESLDEIDSLEEDSDEIEEITLEEPPEIGDKLESLETELEESELSGEMEEDFSVSDDFGLNELGEDFLDDFEEDDSEGSFSLDDLGQEFSLSDEEIDGGSSLGLELDSLEKSIDDQKDGSQEEQFELTSEDMVLLKEALYQLPRNLKLELEDFMADPGSEVDELNKVIDMLIQRVPIKSVASKVGKIRGKKITIPRGYQKLNVQEFQEEQNSLTNQFKEKVLPVTMKILAGFFVLWLLFLLLFNFVYRPLKATSLYKTGDELIALDQYDQGDYYFNQAYFGWKIGKFSVKGWPQKEWFYTYAESYMTRRKYDRAAEIYQLLLMSYPKEKQARLDYAELLVLYMARYQDAEKILLMANPVFLKEVAQGSRTYDQVPVYELAEIRDYDLLLALGDTYFLWGETEPSRFEDARFIYAYIMDFISGGDEVVLRMLRYFMRMNNREEIERWVELYKTKEKVYVEPAYQSEIFSEIAGWLLDQKRNAEAEIFLRKANEADKSIPDVHYQYARYFQALRSLEKEKNALTNALGYLTRLDTSQKKYIHMKIDAYKRLGDILLRQGDTLQAEKDYLLALSIYENAKNRNLVGSSPYIGELFSNIGDLNYREHRDYDTALHYYELARDNYFEPPEMRYRMGYIFYTHKKSYDKALLEFYYTSRALPKDRNVIFAMGNTLYQREDYFGAVSHYERLLTDLREEEQSIGFLVPDQKEEHLALLIMIMKVYNNLGSAQFKAAERSPNRSSISESLSYFTYSSEYYDKISRDRSTLVRSGNTDMAYQNRMTVLKERNLSPMDGEDVLIYKELLTEMDNLPLFF